MKKLLILLFFTNFTFAQHYYFEGNNLNCNTANPEALRLLKGGIKILHLNTDLNKKYLMENADIFARAVLQDTLFCDAYFFTGYTLSLLDKNRESYACYKVADSLCPKPFLLYKLNTAASCLKLGRFHEARTFYNDIVKYFPDSPEGYYGVAVTSPMHFDYKDGLNNLEIAIKKYEVQNVRKSKETMFLKAILLTLDTQYANSLHYFEEAESNYKKDINFNIHYSLALLKTSEQTNDEKMKKQALKYYNKIQNKKEIPEYLQELYTF